MMSEMMKLYCEERYPEWAHLSDLLLETFAGTGRMFFYDEEAFMIYEIEGDALIIHDMFMRKESRRQKKMFSMFEALRAEAMKKNVRVIIGFSEKAGTGAEMGKKAMEYVGFIPFFETDQQTGYIRAA